MVCEPYAEHKTRITVGLGKYLITSPRAAKVLKKAA
jgi:hypothetical protein